MTALRRVCGMRLPSLGARQRRCVAPGWPVTTRAAPPPDTVHLTHHIAPGVSARLRADAFIACDTAFAAPLAIFGTSQSSSSSLQRWQAWRDGTGHHQAQCLHQSFLVCDRLCCCWRCVHQTQPRALERHQTGVCPARAPLFLPRWTGQVHMFTETIDVPYPLGCAEPRHTGTHASART